MEISSTKFVQEFRNPNEKVIENVTIVGDIFFNSTNFKTKKAYIKNCQFDNKLHFQNLNINSGIFFENCIFKDNVIFESVKTVDAGIIYTYSPYNLIFKQCKIDLLGLSQDICLYSGIIIAEKSTVNKLVIEGMVSAEHHGRITIEDSIVYNDLTLKEVSIGQNLSINKSTIECALRIFSSSFNFISLQDSKFKEFYLIHGDVSQGISIGKCEFNGKVDFTSPIVSRNLTLSGTSFNKEFRIKLFDEPSDRYGNINSIYFFDSEFADFFNLIGSFRPIAKIDLSFSSGQKGILLFSECLVSELEARGVNLTCNLVFQECQFNKIKFQTVINKTNISFIKCKAQGEAPEINVLHSDLGVTHFNGFNFTLFNKIEIIDSIVADIVANNVTWFKDVNLKVAQNENDKAINKREFYRQLKLAMDKQGNKIQSLDFKALELFYHEEHLSKNYSYFNQNRLVLNISKTNSFGLNWMKPLLIILGINLLFYLILVIAASRTLEISCESEFNFKLLQDEILKYSKVLPQLFNPTRYVERMFDKIENVDLNVYVYWIDGAQRVFLAFFIFQIIVAFRKFHEK